jgi:hypothetical protein
LTYSTLKNELKQLFYNTGYSTAKPYTIRKSSMKWAARCGGREWEIKCFSRHVSNSKSFYRYIEEGGQDAKQATSSGTREDPIRRLWVFHPTVNHSFLDSSL